MALTIPSSSSSPSIKTNNHSQEPHDVFLSFRGEDTRKGITSHICTALRDKKIKTYFDEDSLQRGTEISPSLLAGIERSKISVIVFSEHYATSSWCLSELVHISKCRQNLGQIVFPIFYKVDPSNVRAEYEGSYKDAFDVHENNPKHSAETVQEWRSALKALGSISGNHYKQSDNRAESALVKEVVETILEELSKLVVSDVDDFDGLIGMNNHFTKLKSLLNDGSSKLQILGIWGMAGIGKTTIANAVSSRLSSQFESFYFLTNVRERSEKHELERLRDDLIAKLLGDKNINSGILPNPIPEISKVRLRETKVLLVLDDVSEKKQLEHLVGNHFGSKSLIIVTTRDEGVLRGTNIEADFNKYEVELFSDEESMELFNLTAFRESSSPPEYEDLPSKVVSRLDGNPLAITVFGSHLRSLCNPSKQDWEMELEKLEDVSHGDIQKVLRISYDGLDKLEKKIFLDIACFFKGEERRFVQNILDACTFYAKTGIKKLIDKSLVTEDWFDGLQMHDLVQQMGQLIVREESEEPGNRSRIWTPKDAIHVFNNDTVTSQIEGIFLDTSKLDEDVHLKPEVFTKMNKLRLLKIYEERDFNLYSRDTRKHKVYVEELDDNFPRSLTYLEWKGYPLKSLPSKFNPCNLVEFKMPYSQLEKTWHGIKKDLDKLTCIDLSHSTNLTQIPDLSRAKNLETLNLRSCKSLVEVPRDSLRNLNKLSDLNLDSTNIVSVPSCIDSMSSLTKLSFNFCYLLKKLPSSIAQLNCLEYLSLNGCSSLEMFPVLPLNIKSFYLSHTVIKEVPSLCFENCSRLSKLHIVYCRELESLPSNIFGSGSSHLKHLVLKGCSNLKNLPEIPNLAESKLRRLTLSKSGIRYLPSSIGELTSLEELDMESCENLEFVDNLSMSSLTELDIKNCKKLQRISQLPLSLQRLNASGCPSLEIVMDSTLNEFRSQFWDKPRKIKSDNFDFSPNRECLKLEQSSILTAFQLGALDIATRPKQFPANTFTHIATWYSGDKIPEWFNHRPNNDSPTSITLMPCPDFLGFVLCAVIPRKSDCEIKFQTGSLTWHNDSDSKHVAMWYPEHASDHYIGHVVTFEYSVKGKPRNEIMTEVTFGVHMLCWNDLAGLGLPDRPPIITPWIVSETEESETEESDFESDIVSETEESDIKSDIVSETEESETEESDIESLAGSPEIADVTPQDSVDETCDRKRNKENDDDISSSPDFREIFSSLFIPHVIFFLFSFFFFLSL